MKQKNTYEFYHNTSKLKVLKSKENLLFKMIHYSICFIRDSDPDL